MIMNVVMHEAYRNANMRNITRHNLMYMTTLIGYKEATRYDNRSYVSYMSHRMTTLYSETSWY
jgi:hypothetical protein